MGRPETIDAPADVSPQVVLRVEQLQAGYGRKQVVFDVDLTVREGEILGVLGHNGSGKSTTIRTILGLNPVIGGTDRVQGSGRHSARARATTSRRGWR